VAVQTKNQSLVKTILLTWLLCGTLDMLSALIINPGATLAAVCRYIAGGFFVAGVLKNAAALIVAFGFPIVFIADRYYK
jgi:hypothetical protein